MWMVGVGVDVGEWGSGGVEEWMWLSVYDFQCNAETFSTMCPELTGAALALTNHTAAFGI